MNIYIRVFGYVHKLIKDRRKGWRRTSANKIYYQVQHDEPENRVYKVIDLLGNKLYDLSPERKKEIKIILDYLVEKNYLRTVETNNGYNLNYTAYTTTKYGRERYDLFMNGDKLDSSDKN